MKKLPFLFAVLLALVGWSVAFAAYTKQSARVQRIQMDLVLAPDGTVSAVNLDGFVQVKRLVNDSDANDVVEDAWRKVSFNLLSVGNTTAATKTCNGTQTAALLRQMVLDQATAQGIQ
jgi:hypothetical protein